MDDALFFCDTLTQAHPYLATRPRNHESLCFVTRGTLGYEKDGMLVRIPAGQTAYIARGSVDQSSALDCAEVSYIAVNFNFDLDDPAPSPTLFFPTLCCEADRYRLGDLFQTALDEYRLSLPGSRMICNGILWQIIGILQNHQLAGSQNNRKAQKLAPSLEYLRLHYGRPDLKISTLAQICGLSEKQFRRTFVELYGKQPHEYLRDYRLNRAKELLLNNSKRISGIALECGFSDVYSFSHCFRNFCGMSPEQYKSAMK